MRCVEIYFAAGTISNPADRMARIYSMEIISEEQVGEKDLETAMHGKKSFTVMGVPE